MLVNENQIPVKVINFKEVDNDGPVHFQEWWSFQFFLPSFSVFREPPVFYPYNEWKHNRRRIQ